jgi:hypothetical protein
MRPGFFICAVLLADWTAPLAVPAPGGYPGEDTPRSFQEQTGRPAPARGTRPTILDRLEQMSPAERRRALAKLPPVRRQRLQERLARYERLSPKERNQLRQQLRRFRELPPDKQAAIRDFRNLPPVRRRALRQEANGLNRLSDAGRQERMSSAAFHAHYSPEEERMILGLMALTRDR